MILEVDSAQTEITLKAYPDRVGRALVRAINRAVASARTVLVREIARDTGLKASAVRKALPLREATLNRAEGRLAASLKRIPLIDFGARGPEPSRGKGRGVSYRLAGGRNRLEHAFIAMMKTGHRGVFMRKAKARLGIRELKGPSLGHVFAKYRPLALARAKEIFETNFKHELEYTGGGGGVSDAGGSA